MLKDESQSFILQTQFNMTMSCNIVEKEMVISKTAMDYNTIPWCELFHQLEPLNMSCGIYPTRGLLSHSKAKRLHIAIHGTNIEVKACTHKCVSDISRIYKCQFPTKAQTDRSRASLPNEWSRNTVFFEFYIINVLNSLSN